MGRSDVHIGHLFNGSLKQWVKQKVQQVEQCSLSNQQMNMSEVYKTMPNIVCIGMPLIPLKISKTIKLPYKALDNNMSYTHLQLRGIIYFANWHFTA